MRIAETISAGILPVDIIFGDRDANLHAATRMAKEESARHNDIIMLPELFSTGYKNDAAAMHELAEPCDGPTMRCVREISIASDAAVCGSFAFRAADGRYANRAFFVTPDGNAVFYDKRHLFSMSSEADVFSAGRHPVPVIEYRGWKVAMCVCYDLRFPAWMRNTGYAYDIMLMPANWPRSRAYALEHLLIARAIENQAPIVCCNRGGADAYGHYDGCSFAFDQMGHPALDARSMCARFDLAALREARRRFAAARDADTFRIDY